ncbi:hypothetical protein ACFOSC_11420 [Streptantibioticus rubrisoli]|uniref:Uncharacterized protein n=1 Tax=Streptantibioticus rubrisoli TaxID=1387313 RepID=A0ABT1PEC3_9ACTN|nr:hypothetical protein [Streptantibioticus rubrisoli]MCQ4043722.1 hypothetical protein [Streptantibioticus rubrisoli]
MTTNANIGLAVVGEYFLGHTKKTKTDIGPGMFPKAYGDRTERADRNEAGAWRGSGVSRSVGRGGIRDLADEVDESREPVPHEHDGAAARRDGATAPVVAVPPERSAPADGNEPMGLMAHG